MIRGRQSFRAKLARELREYDIERRQVKEGENRGRGYWSDEVEKAVKQYESESGGEPE